MTLIKISSSPVAFATQSLLMPAVHAQITDNAGISSPAVVEDTEGDPLDQGVVVQSNTSQKDADLATAETSTGEQNTRTWEAGCSLSHHSILAKLRILYEHALVLTQIVRESAHGRAVTDSAINTTERDQQKLNSGRR